MKIKKILIALLWMAVLAGVVVMVVYAGSRYDNVVYKGYTINVALPEGSERLISEADVDNMILTQVDSLIGKKFKDIDLDKIEKMLKNNAYISDAEITGNMWGTLQIDVRQRKPVARIINKNNEQYYIDSTGAAMPARLGMPARVVVVNGNVTTKYGDFRPDTIIREIQDVLYCVNALNKDDFLRAQIGQVFIEENGDFVLIPLLGNHTVLLGDPYVAEDRLENLRIFYKRGLGVEEWKKSKCINIRFKDKVVVQNRK